MHVLDHRGEHFTVRGPLNVNPSPQGKPVILQAVTPETIAGAVHPAEVLLVADTSLEAGGARAAEMRRALEGRDRNRSAVRLLANVVPWIGATAAQAQDRFEALNARSLPGSAQTPQGRDVIGTAADVADALQESFERGGLDGFTILPPVAPGGLEMFVDHVVPELRRRGLFRANYAGSTLRDHLGLERPARSTET
jgi:N-acetyl-S-(2-succino)cysteine monooxygenase